MDKKRDKLKAWDVMESKELEKVSRKASAAKHGKSDPEGSTLVRISSDNHKALRIIAAVEGVAMQDIIDRLVTEYKAKYHPNL